MVRHPLVLLQVPVCVKRLAARDVVHLKGADMTSRSIFLLVVVLVGQPVMSLLVSFGPEGHEAFLFLKSFQ